ncbi:receptor-like serine/threonine-protein kinase SD1-6 [Cinnamomum micranthum f. kanehirae]|uniref:Receptor-like serine/threonine-protein kinase SD1-6 n=1 Tax=Cinnamomum micranthum f. kanehirae TaxID=337451 RepID=A0A3S3PLV4_9MAGN|nr:receptor-like serine/threonine-protein kinase SD1-6 [Cinnamomum micranthum f. kanehirae]
MPNVNVLTVSKGPSAALVDEVSKVADSLPNTRSRDGVCRVLDVAVFEVAILEPCRPNGVHSERKEIDDGVDCVNENIELPLFTFKSIIIATNNFSATNKLGERGFVSVY